MARVLLVDDSDSARRLLTAQLAERGYEVVEAADPLTAAELALSRPPDLVLTDMWMPGVSGVQLCRLLRAEPRTANVPVILITNESQRRSRFWAKTAGAAGYVTKNDPAGLFATLERILVDFPPQSSESVRPASRTPMQHRLFQRLDAALFESVVSGEIRALAHDDAEAETVFRGLASLASEVTAYRWLALALESPARLFVHAHSDAAKTAVSEARDALHSPDGVEVVLICDDRALTGAPMQHLAVEVRAAGKLMGVLAIGPSPRGASTDDREFVSIAAAQLGGPLRILVLVEQAQRLAMSDPLTGLVNRRAFLDLLTRSMAGLDRHGDPLSVLLLDVDHFKQVNDNHGHDAGDAVLVGIADLLRSLARKTDFVGRWGGEEFVVGLAHTGGAMATVPAERIRRAIMDHRFRLPSGREIQLTASIGVVVAVKGERGEALIARADRAMYLAKSRGRNRWVVENGDAVSTRPL